MKDLSHPNIVQLIGAFTGYDFFREPRSLIQTGSLERSIIRVESSEMQKIQRKGSEAMPEEDDYSPSIKRDRPRLNRPNNGSKSNSRSSSKNLD
jgi:hypothetical protein